MAEKDTKNATPEKKKKKLGLFKKIGKFFRESRSELKKVVWPTPKQVLNNTGVVLAMIVIIGAFVGALDFGLTAILRAIV